MVFQRFWAGWDLAYVQGAPASLVRLAEMDLDAEQSMRIYQAILEMQAAIGVWLDRKPGPPPPNYRECVRAEDPNDNAAAPADPAAPSAQPRSG